MSDSIPTQIKEGIFLTKFETKYPEIEIALEDYDRGDMAGSLYTKADCNKVIEFLQANMGNLPDE